MNESWLKKQKKETLIKIILELEEDLDSLDAQLKKYENTISNKNRQRPFRQG